MTPIAVEMLADIDKDTVDWVPNYDGSRQEPTVLPGKFPNLICNGSAGIAVGMATNIPPHNLNEVADALLYLIDHPDATVLSAGMSGDLEAAIACGATHVRVGSAVLGTRPAVQ